MRRGVAGALIALCILVLAACGDDAGWTSAPPESVSARFAALNDVIVVNATDRLPLRSAVLVAPDGERVDAYSLDVSSSPVVERSPGEAVLMSNPGAPRQVTRLDTMVSTALILLPDPNGYAKVWQDSRIALVFGDPGGEREVTLPAPKPPP
jgi:hypothetical protein